MGRIDDLIKKHCPDAVEFKQLGEMVKDQFRIMPATPNFTASGEVPYIRFKNIRAGNINFTKVKYISRSDYFDLRPLHGR